MSKMWPVKNKKGTSRPQELRYASPDAGGGTTVGSSGSDRNAVYRQPNTNQQLLLPQNSLLPSSRKGFFRRMVDWWVSTPDPIHAHVLYDAPIGSSMAQVRAVRLLQDTAPIPVKETTTGATQRADANAPSSLTSTGTTTSSLDVTGRGASAPRNLIEQQRLLNAGVNTYYAVGLPPPTLQDQSQMASQAPQAAVGAGSTSGTMASSTTGQDKSKQSTTTTTMPVPAESKTAASVPPGATSTTTTTTGGATAPSQGKTSKTDRKAARQQRRQENQRWDQDLTRPLSGGMRFKTVLGSLIGLALRGLLAGVIFFPIFWSLGIGITAAIWGNDEGDDNNVYTRNRFPLPPLILAVYGGVLGLFQTPLLALTVLWHGSRYAFPALIGGTAPITGTTAGEAGTSAANLVPMTATTTTAAAPTAAPAMMGADTATISVVDASGAAAVTTAAQQLQAPSVVVAT
jgi:Protein of unknown function (DUF2456)